MYSLEQLKIFTEVAATGSFSACARKLSKAQSAISQAIAGLEIDIDTPLFDRSARKPTLTPAGEKLLGYAQAVLKQSQEFGNAASALAREQEAQLSVVIDSGLMTSKLLDIISELNRRFIATEINIHTLASPDIIDHITAGAADIGLMFCDAEFASSIDICYLGDTLFYAVAAPGHPLSAMTSINSGDLMPYQQLLIHSSRGEYLAHFSPIATKRLHCDNFDSLQQLTRLGLGWSYLPCHMADEDIANGKLCQLPVSFDYKPWRAPVERVRANHGTVGPALSWLDSALKTLFD
ncbi:HTH-type transcriptional regulator YhaJ [Sinobacterium norvegicum]|uniref:HTH-type transcriptional regulator YhaJ n=2 Tax=Sinobacterium norvegicum TaxID=1641715 RepID=A0ABM9AHC3_9GAMM|nr:HTH-type transcriptional regulator YhaJ [Sinobacterium norvegicum]